MGIIGNSYPYSRKLHTTNNYIVYDRAMDNLFLCYDHSHRANKNDEIFWGFN